MSAQRAFYRPEQSQPVAPSITPGDECRDCYTPADTWLRRLANKAKKPMPNSSTQELETIRPNVHTDVALQHDSQPVLSLVPMPVVSDLNKSEFVYESATATLISVNDRERYRIRDIKEFMGERVLEFQVIRLDLQKYGTPECYITIRPYITSLLKELRVVERLINGPREAKHHPDQLSLLEKMK